MPKLKMFPLLSCQLTDLFHFHACLTIIIATIITEVSSSITYGYATVVTFIINSKSTKTAAKNAPKIMFSQ